MNEKLLKIINEEIVSLTNKQEIEEDFNTNLFIEGVITEEEYSSIMLNENMVSKTIASLASKALGMLKSAFSNVKKLGKKALSIAKTVWGFASKFCGNNPLLCKVILVLIIMLLVNVGTAYANTTGDSETPKMMYDAAIGFLEKNSDLLQSDYGQMDFMQAKTILYGIRDGVGDITSMDDPDMAKVSQQSQALAKHALNFMDGMAQQAKQDPDKMKTFYDYVMLGKKFIMQSSSVMEE